MPGVPWHTQILSDQLTLFQPEGTDYAHLITTGTPGFSDLPTALLFTELENCAMVCTPMVCTPMVRIPIVRKPNKQSSFDENIF